MKRLLFVILLLVLNFTLKAQGFPLTQNLASDSTLVRIGTNSKGAIRGSLIPSTYTDTATANAGRIDDYPFAIIGTSSDGKTWMRNYLATGWVQLSGGTSPSGSFWNVGGNLLPVYPTPYARIGTLTPYGGALSFITNSVDQLVIPNGGIVRSSAAINKYLMMDTSTKEMYYGDGGTTYTSSNGITLASNNFKLGGTLGQNTTITLDGFNLNIPDFQSFGDTTNWKPVVVNTTGTGGTAGDTRRATYWPGGSGSLGTLDTLPYPPWTVVQDAGGTSYKTAGQRVFNVKDYGATGDGATDDTQEIQAAINAAHANFGGVVYFPIGHYIIADTLRTTSVPGNPNAQLYIPLSPYSANTDSLRTIELVGEVAPNYFSDPTANKNNPTTSVILESTLRNTGNLLGASTETFSTEQMNHTYVKIKNIKFRTDTDSSGVVVGATQTAINASRMAMFSAEDVIIDVANLYLSVVPKNTAYGIKLPLRWNYVMSELKRVSVQGMYSGISLSEHADLSDVFVDACYNGIEFLASDYGAHIDRIIIARCVNAILVSGATIFTIDDLNIEFKTDNFTPIGAWFNTVYCIKEDASNTLGYIRSYTVVESGVGLNNSMFNRNTNSSYITAKTANRVTPVWRTSTRPYLDYGVIGYNTTLSTLEFRDSLQNVWQTVGSNRGVGSVSYNQGTGSGATEELTYDAASNWLNVRSTTAAYNTTIGQLPSAATYGGLWVGNNTPTTSNYAITGNGSSETILNVGDASGSIILRANNGASPNIATMKAGQTGFYQNTPTAKLHIGAGTATASTAPLKFTTSAAVLLTTPEAGAIETKTDSLYYTDSSGNRKKFAFMEAVYNVQTGTSYTLTAYDNGKIVTLNNGSAITLTVPAGLPAGFRCDLVQLGVGQVTITPSSTTVNNRQSFTKLKGRYAACSLIMYTSDTFISQGDME